MLVRDTSSCPSSPARSPTDYKIIERLEIENNHLREQVSLLQFELDNRRRAFFVIQEINATNEARARNAEARLVYLKQSNKELALQVEKLSKRSHREERKVDTAERAVAQLEAQNAWLEAQLKAALYENTKVQSQQQQHHQQQQSLHHGGPHTVVFREVGSAPPEMQTIQGRSTRTIIARGSGGLDEETVEKLANDRAADPVVIVSAGNSLSLSLSLSEESSLAAAHQQQQLLHNEQGTDAVDPHLNEHHYDDANDTINNQFSFPVMASLPMSPPQSMQHHQQHAMNDKDEPPRRNTYAEAITGIINNSNNNNFGSTNNHHLPIAANKATAITVNKKKRATYGTLPRFIEIRRAYTSVLTSQAAEEDPLARWVRTVMSNNSAVETDPKKVDPVLVGLKQLFEENGVPLPLRKTGSCQFQLVASGSKSVGQRLSVRLINGRLMARSGGPAWVDIFEWLERQPLYEEEKTRN